MTRRSARCSASSRRPALTLVEVLASTVLVGTLLVSIIGASARLNRAEAKAAQRLLAVGEADRLLAAWQADPGSLPVASGAEGDLGACGLRWRSRAGEAPVDGSSATLVELAILATGEEEPLLRVFVVAAGAPAGRGPEPGRGEPTP